MKKEKLENEIQNILLVLPFFYLTLQNKLMYGNTKENVGRLIIISGLPS